MLISRDAAFRSAQHTRKLIVDAHNPRPHLNPKIEFAPEEEATATPNPRPVSRSLRLTKNATPTLPIPGHLTTSHLAQPTADHERIERSHTAFTCARPLCIYSGITLLVPPKLNPCAWSSTVQGTQTLWDSACVRTWGGCIERERGSARLHKCYTCSKPLVTRQTGQVSVFQSGGRQSQLQKVPDTPRPPHTRLACHASRLALGYR
mmetsp:Transcript_22716/g.69426  ORF Transcript_22716/g.69426 Transcript_22716/m.69426 type:complete len:206 (-) Transcript_22716:1054-1671(-)